MISNERMFAVLEQEWTNGLQGISDELLQYGLDGINESAGTFSPSLPAFIAACKRPSRLAPYHLPPKARGGYLGVETDNQLLGYTPAPVGKHFSLYEEKLRKDREEKERIKHMDDDLDERKRKSAEAIKQRLEK